MIRHPLLVIPLLLVSLVAVPGFAAASACDPTTVTPDGHSTSVLRHGADQSFTADFIIPNSGCTINTTWSFDASGIYTHYSQRSYTDATGLHVEASVTLPGTLGPGSHTVVASFDGCGNPTCTNTWTATAQPCLAYVSAGESPTGAIAESRPLISASFTDPNPYACDPPSNPTVTLDGQPLEASVSGHTVTAQPSLPLLPGPHAVTASLSNGDGIATTSSWTFYVDGAGGDTGPIDQQAGTPDSVGIPYESIGPVSIGPFTEPLPALLGVDIHLGGKGAIVHEASSTTIPEIDVQKLTGEPVPFTICADPAQCTFQTPSADPILEPDSITVTVLGQAHTLVLP